MTKQEEAYWSEGGQVFFCDGNAYGLRRNLANVHLGTEQELLEALSGKTVESRLIQNIITMDINNRGKQAGAIPRSSRINIQPRSGS